MKVFYTTLFALLLFVACVSAAPAVRATDAEKKEIGAELMKDKTDGLEVSVRGGHGYHGGYGPPYYYRRRRSHKRGRRGYGYGRRGYGRRGYGRRGYGKYYKYGGYGSSSDSDGYGYGYGYGSGSDSGYSS